MREVIIRYPHFVISREPRPIRRDAVWQVAQEARQQILSHPRRPKIDVGVLAARSRRLRVNGLPFETCWSFDQPVVDRAGNAALGATEVDETRPEAALIRVNTGLIGEAEELTRSTALHELGHAVFDAPAWLTRVRKRAAGGMRAELKVTGVLGPKQPQARPRIDWREWRANEFMGAFLVPGPLLHEHMIRKASLLGLPMIQTEADERPLLARPRAELDRIDALVFDLAELFGVSAPFIEVRLRKYGLVRDRGDRLHGAPG